jgi:hypothetical protein
MKALFISEKFAHSQSGSNNPGIYHVYGSLIFTFSQTDKHGELNGCVFAMFHCSASKGRSVEYGKWSGVPPSSTAMEISGSVTCEPTMLRHPKALKKQNLHHIQSMSRDWRIPSDARLGRVVMWTIAQACSICSGW